MEGEIQNYFKVWLSVFISLCYCYAVGKKIPEGIRRLFCFLPVVGLFLYLPLNLSSIHLGGTTAFFVAWLANFKLLLFVFGKGPLSSSLSLSRFLAVACLPIKIQQNPHQKSHLNGLKAENVPPTSHLNSLKEENAPSKSHLNGLQEKNSTPKSHLDCQNKANTLAAKPGKGHKSPLNYGIKLALFAVLLRMYDYSEYLHPRVILFLYSLHIYVCLEMILAMVAALARTLLGLELEQQFNEPYLSTSLQDFWGRRWNIMVTRILRPTVYEPVLQLATRLMGRKWAVLPAVFGTFMASALMHELIFYYLGRVRPSWEITWFFILHGTCLIMEIAVKKSLHDRWVLPRVVSTPLTVGFVMVTAFRLFFPQLLRCRADQRAFQEYAAVGTFFKNISRVVTLELSTYKDW